MRKSANKKIIKRTCFLIQDSPLMDGQFDFSTWGLVTVLPDSLPNWQLFQLIAYYVAIAAALAKTVTVIMWLSDLCAVFTKQTGTEFCNSVIKLFLFVLKLVFPFSYFYTWLFAKPHKKGNSPAQ